MTESKHTPGPWHITGPSSGKGPSDDGGDYAIRSCGNYIIAEAIHKVDHNTYEPAESNARLIAAAPEMLEALNWLVSEVRATMSLAEESMRESAGNTNIKCLLDRLTQAEAAIAKAVQS